MASRQQPVIFLHVGVMKTGTTYIQRLLWRNRAALKDAGILIPGRAAPDQPKAARDILGIFGGDPKIRTRTEGTWERLTSQMLAWDGNASVFSMEFLSFAGKGQMNRVMESLVPAKVHVVLSIRDTAEVLPAQWQSHTRNRGTASWPEFARAAANSLEEGEDGAAKTFLRAQNIPRILKVWGTSVPSERLHVVTVPPRGSSKSLLWERFATSLSVDPEVCRARNVRPNASLGHSSADFLRRLNRSLGEVPSSDYDRTMRHLAREALSSRSSLEGRPSMDQATERFAGEWNERVRTAVLRSKAQVVGDLDDLPVSRSRAGSSNMAVAHLAEPDPSEVLAAAATARDWVCVQLGGQGSDPEGTPTSADRWSADPDPLGAAADEVAGLIRQLIGRA